MQVLIEEYTPCRANEVYLDENGVIEILGKSRLKGVGRDIWLMLDGKHSIRSITEYLCAEFFVSAEYAVIKEELIAYLVMLKKRDAIIVNWNPLYKLNLCQELVYSE